MRNEAPKKDFLKKAFVRDRTIADLLYFQYFQILPATPAEIVLPPVFAVAICALSFHVIGHHVFLLRRQSHNTNRTTNAVSCFSKPQGPQLGLNPSAKVHSLGIQKAYIGIVM